MGQLSTMNCKLLVSLLVVFIVSNESSALPQYIPEYEDLPENNKPCDRKHSDCLPKCSELSDEDINRGLQCKIDDLPPPNGPITTTTTTPKTNSASLSNLNVEIVSL